LQHPVTGDMPLRIVDNFEVVDVKEGDHEGLPCPLGPADLTFQFRKARAASIHASQTIDNSATTVLGRRLAIRRRLQTVGGTFPAISKSRLAIKFRLPTLQSPGLPVVRSPFPVGRSFTTRQLRAIEGVPRNPPTDRGLKLLADLVPAVTCLISLVAGSVPLVAGVVSDIGCLISQLPCLVAPLAGPITRVTDPVALVRCPVTLVPRPVTLVTHSVTLVTREVSAPTGAIPLIRYPISLITG
jgi:hypothetical protein